ncbi:hypothetical protein BGZ65_005410 [Modicella reniformis]|uniref:Uncharacterized protein n=1 Tax=Modicella reniformis TaxID=1440133 RepID=A0A9P6IKH0_9FUNG|nr:hypothetical protein BGZ65_005410 [Modicella reniformis]
MPPRERCCWCIPFRLATFLGGLLLSAIGAAGCYFYFTNNDLPNRPITVGTLSANRRFVKAFEAFYVLSLLTQFAFIVWALIWCKQNQTPFDTVCNAYKDGLVDLPVPGFASDWSCQKIFTAGILTIGVGGIIWLGFNFYMTNRVIQYARELFAEKANRYKVLSEAATKELDREQQIPLNYTNVGRSMNEQEGPRGSHLQQPSYRDEIEYKDPRGADSYQDSHTAAAAAAGFGSFGHDMPQQYQNQHQPPVAPGFNHRDSTQGLDLINPGYGEQETVSGANATEAAPSALYHAQGSGQSFVHASTNKIVSPFEDDEPVAQTAPTQPDGTMKP